jgi:hypothetical protein
MTGRELRRTGRIGRPTEQLERRAGRNKAEFNSLARLRHEQILCFGFRSEHAPHAFLLLRLRPSPRNGPMAKKTVTVAVQDDHLAKLSKTGRPALAIAELIWNGLDADAMSVSVEFLRTGFDTIEAIQVIDDGHGINDHDVEAAFRNLGGSWKRINGRSRELKRLLHGKEGKGRFRAFSLGEEVTWTSRYEHNGDCFQIQVSGRASNPRRFDIEGPVPAAPGSKAGTEVIVTSLFPEVPEFGHSDFVEELTEIFALYLTEYPDVRVEYAGVRLDPSSLEHRTQTYKIEPFHEDGIEIPGAELTVIEWKAPQKRSMYLCDREGFTFGKVPPGVQASGFSFTAYIRSDYLRELDKDNALALGEMHPGLTALVSASREKLKDHFLRRAAEEAKTLVDDWKKDRIYPYEGEPANVVERTERQVFDVLAYNVNNYLPSFSRADRVAKQFSFRLLKQALEENPQSLNKILQEVLSLPRETQNELAALLERTSLSRVFAAAKDVADRLDFLHALEMLVFRPDSKKQLQERSELHRILAEETWIFGEEFNLSVDDQSLTEVLRRHQEILRRETPETVADNLPEAELAPVLRGDGSVGIVDLMLSRRIPQPQSQKREHLVIELKRPSQSINAAVAQQIRSYGFAIENDERFRSTDTRWTLWAVSNRVTDEARWQLKVPEAGILHQSDRMTIYLREWGQVLEECRSRLTFFQDRLQYEFSDDSALAYLRKTHEKYLPDVYREQDDAAA